LTVGRNSVTWWNCRRTKVIDSSAFSFLPNQHSLRSAEFLMWPTETRTPIRSLGSRRREAQNVM